MSIPAPANAEIPSDESIVPFESRQIIYLLIFFAVCYLAFLGHYPLIDPDEPVYAETGKLMAWSHGFAAWWTPHYNGQMWFDKPPVTYWIVGLSMKLLGVSEFAARLPMALAGLALIWVTARLTHRLYPQSKSAPVWAALSIGSCGESLVLSHACVTDILFVLSLSVALLNVWEWMAVSRWKPILWSGVAVGVGVMIKGPVAIVLIGALLLLTTAANRQIARFFSAQVWLSLLLALAIAAPWYLSMVAIHGQYFVQSFLEAQNVTRYLTAEHSTTASPFFFIPVLLAGFMPWTFALIPALVTSFQRARSGEIGDRLAVIWIALVFVFFSASQSKLVTYIYPLYPLAAAVTGFWIAECMKPRSGAWLYAGAALVAFIAVQQGIEITWQIPARALLLAGILAGVAGGILMALFNSLILRGRIGRLDIKTSTDLSMALPGIILALLIPAAAAGPMWRHPDPKSLTAFEIASSVKANSKAGDTVYALTFLKPSLVYYSDRVIIFTDRQEVVGPALYRAPYPICVTKPDIIVSLERKRLLGRYRILAQTQNRVVLIRCDPPNRADE
jgi:4-amino-4-deoxy-L-arabinose transferase-like glycosyltransferase